MNITPFDVYLVMQLDSIQSACRLIFGALLVATLAVLIIGLFQRASSFRKGDDDYRNGIAKIWIGAKIGSITFIFLLFASFVPSTKTAASMFLLPAIANNKEVQQLPEDLLKMVRGLVKEWTPKEDVKKEGN